jgi:hypothetical protein
MFSPVEVVSTVSLTTRYCRSQSGVRTKRHALRTGSLEVKWSARDRGDTEGLVRAPFANNEVGEWRMSSPVG